MQHSKDDRVTAEVVRHNPKKMSQLQLNQKSIIAVGAIGIVTVYALYSVWSGPIEKTVKPAVIVKSDSDTWKTQNLIDIPEKILKKSVEVTERYTEISYEEQTLKIYLKEVNAGAKDVIPNILFLHGMAFSSQNWEDIKTLQLVGAMGLRAVAIDLPRFGKSKDTGKIDDKGKFLKNLIEKEQLGKPIIVSPSMSGSFSIPYIMEPKPQTCADRLFAFIPVAPANTEAYKHPQYHRCEIPVMIVYGTKDKGLGLDSTGNLRNMPNNEIFPMEKAGHPSYIDKPDEWNRLLYNFLLAMEKYKQ